MGDAIGLDTEDVSDALSKNGIFKFDVTDADDNWLAVTGTWAEAADANIYGQRKLWNDAAAPAINESVVVGHLYVPVTGTYTAYLKYTKDPNAAKCHFMLNNVDKGNIDMYAAGADNNAISSVSLGSLTKGLYVLVLKGASKNAGSGGYWQIYHSLYIVKT
jgi:hypothetical protein